MCIRDSLDAFFNRVRVGVVLSSSAIKPAKLAIRHTYVRVVKMPVYVVIRRKPVLPPPNRIRQLAKRIQVTRRKQHHPVVKAKPLTVFDLKGDVDQIAIERKLH
jgi:hypothetical protein